MRESELYYEINLFHASDRETANETVLPEYCIQKAQGGWIDDDGMEIEEAALVIVLSVRRRSRLILMEWRKRRIHVEIQKHCYRRNSAENI